MPTSEVIAAKISADIKEFKSGMVEANKSLKTLATTSDVVARDTTRNLSRIDDHTEKLSKTWQRAKSTMFGFVAGSGVLNLVQGAFQSLKGATIDYNQTLDQASIGFKTMLGDAQKAKVFLSELEEFAARTPFEFPELIGAAQRLMSMGTAAGDVKHQLTAVGDAVAALGGSMQYQGQIIIRALGQMQAKGKVSAEEMLQLTEAGISAWQYLADSQEKTVAEMMDTTRKSVVDSGTAINAILAGMEKDFGGMMEAQSKSLMGSFSTVKDYIAKTVAGMTRPLFDSLKTGMNQAAAFLSGPKMIELGQKATVVMSNLFKMIGEGAKRLRQELEPGFKNILAAAKNILPIATKLWSILKVPLGIGIMAAIKAFNAAAQALKVLSDWAAKNRVVLIALAAVISMKIVRSTLDWAAAIVDKLIAALDNKIKKVAQTKREIEGMTKAQKTAMTAGTALNIGLMATVTVLGLLQREYDKAKESMQNFLAEKGMVAQLDDLEGVGQRLQERARVFKELSGELQTAQENLDNARAPHTIFRRAGELEAVTDAMNSHNQTLTDWYRMEGDLQSRLKVTRESIRATADAMGINENATKKQKEALGALVKIMKDENLGVDQMKELAQTFGQDLSQASADAIKDMGSAWKKLQTISRITGFSLADLKTKAEELGVTFKDAKSVNDFAAALDKMNQKEALTKKLTEGLSDKMKELVTKFSEAEDIASAFRQEIDRIFGEMLGVEDARSAWLDSLDALAEGYKDVDEQGKKIKNPLDIYTKTGRENRGMIRDIVKDHRDLIQAHAEAVNSGEITYDQFLAYTQKEYNAAKQRIMEVTGLASNEVESMLAGYGLKIGEIKEAIKANEITVENAKAMQAFDEVADKAAWLKQNYGITTLTIQTQMAPVVQGPSLRAAEYTLSQAGSSLANQLIGVPDASYFLQQIGGGGGRFHSRANGGIDFFANGAERHVAHIARRPRMFAEPETGGEAYIPLAMSKRRRSSELLSAVAKQFGMAFEGERGPGVNIENLNVRNNAPLDEKRLAKRIVDRVSLSVTAAGGEF